MWDRGRVDANVTMRYPRSGSIDRLLPEGSIRSRLAGGAFWAMVAAGLSQAGNLLVSIACARILGSTGLGELSIVNSTVVSLGIFAGLGLGLTATKHVAQFRATDKARVGRILSVLDRVILVTALATSVVLAIAAPWIADRVLGAPDLTDALRVGSLLLFVSELNGYQTGALAGFEAFRVIAAVNLARAAILLPASILGAVVAGVPGAVFAAALAGGVAVLANRWALSREKARAGITASGGRLRDETGLIWFYALPAFLASALVAVTTWVAATMLVNAPGGFAELGQFHAANQWRTAILFFPTVLGQVVLPILASLLGTGAGRSARRVLLASTAVSLGVALPFSLALALLNGWVLALYGPEFADAGPILVVMAATILIVASQMPIAQLIIASGKMWLGAGLNLLWAIVLVACTAAFLERGMGGLGLALAYLVAYVVLALATAAAGLVILGRKRQLAMTDVVARADAVAPPGVGPD